MRCRQLALEIGDDGMSGRVLDEVFEDLEGFLMGCQGLAAQAQAALRTTQPVPLDRQFLPELIDSRVP